MSRIVIAGDLFAGGANERSLQNRTFVDSSAVAEILRSSAFAVANLEAPLTSCRIPRRKLGPNLRADPGAARGLAGMGISGVNLANNHIMDFGWAGLADTIRACESEAIAVFGAGANRQKAGEPLICTVDGQRVGFLGVAEHDGVVATDSGSGPMPADPILVHRWILDHRQSMDQLIVLLHGSLEHFPYPTPRVRALCRFLVDCGADAVICQHTHMIGCDESYRGAPIVYGQGNFMFDYQFPRESWWTGLLVVLGLQPGQSFHLNYEVIESSIGVAGVRVAEAEKARAVLDAMAERSAQLQDADEYGSVWRKHCAQHASWYLNWLDQVPPFLRKVDRRIGMSRVLRSTARRVSQHNVIACESHREVLLAALDNEDCAHCSEAPR